MAIFGGKNIADFFRVKKNTGGTAYEFYQVDGITASAILKTCLRMA